MHEKGNRLWPSQTSDNWNDHNRVAHQDDECWIILTQLQWRNSTSHSTVCLIITRLQWITHLLYTSRHRALFIPPTCHVRFNPSVRRHAVKLCCEMFFTHPVILLAHNSILMLRKREGRPSSGGGRIVMALKSFSEKLHSVIYMSVCVCVYVPASVL